jgi:alcohol dehydrogenase (cytochrome c)
MKRTFIGIGIAASITAVTAILGAVQAQQPQASTSAAPPAPAPATAPLTVVPPILQKYSPVTAQRLLKPEPENWLMIRGTYDGWGYSPLKQITSANVGKLRQVWKFDTGEMKTHQAAPIVNNGVMFISTPNNQVLALNARDGTVLWRYRRPRPAGAIVLHDTNRGVALFGDKVYWAAGEQILVALDARTGKEVWTAKVAENTSGYYANLAPLVAGGNVLIGTSGGELGVRGFVAAFDANTGAEKWRTYTVPAPGEPGSETWPKGGEHWKTGGGPVWVTGNYDPETNLAYWGTGNGGPWMGDARPGDNLYTASTIAVDVTTGKLKGHFQYTPNESFDWDEASPPILLDYQRGGRTVKGLINVARNGYIYFLERTSNEIKFRDGKPYVRQTVFRSLDPVTGRPDIDPNTKPTTGGPMRTFCPSAHGGKNWPPVAFNPQTRMVYVPANNNMCGAMTGVPVTYTAGRGYSGVQYGGNSVAPGADHFGEVQAWNVDTGQRVWMHPYAKNINWGSMLTTAGNLVFSGGTGDKKIHAFDATSGKLLWEFETNSGIVAPPTTFMVDGKQHLAVHAGWGGDPRGMQAGLNRMFPGEFPEVPEGGALWIFAVE